MSRKIGILAVFLGFIGSVVLSETSLAKISWLPDFDETTIGANRLSTASTKPNQRNENLQCSDFRGADGNLLLDVDGYKSMIDEGKRCKRFSHVVKGTVCYGDCTCDPSKYPVNMTDSSECTYCAAEDSCSDGADHCRYCSGGCEEAIDAVCHESLGCKERYAFDDCTKCKECYSCADKGYTQTSCAATDDVEECPADPTQKKCTPNECAESCVGAGYSQDVSTCASTETLEACGCDNTYKKCISKSCAELSYVQSCNGEHGTHQKPGDDTCGDGTWFKCVAMNEMEMCNTDGFKDTSCDAASYKVKDETKICSHSSAYFTCRDMTSGEKCVHLGYPNSGTPTNNCSTYKKPQKCTYNTEYYKMVDMSDGEKCTCDGFVKDKVCTEYQTSSFCTHNTTYIKCTDLSDEEKCVKDSFVKDKVCTTYQNTTTCPHGDLTNYRKCSDMTNEEKCEYDEFVTTVTSCDKYFKLQSCPYLSADNDYKKCFEMTAQEKCAVDGFDVLGTCAEGYEKTGECTHDASYISCELASTYCTPGQYVTKGMCCTNQFSTGVIGVVTDKVTSLNPDATFIHVNNNLNATSRNAALPECLINGFVPASEDVVKAMMVADTGADTSTFHTRPLFGYYYWVDDPEASYGKIIKCESADNCTEITLPSENAVAVPSQIVCMGQAQITGTCDSDAVICNFRDYFYSDGTCSSEVKSGMESAIWGSVDKPSTVTYPEVTYTRVELSTDMDAATAMNTCTSGRLHPTGVKGTLTPVGYVPRFMRDPQETSYNTPIGVIGAWYWDGTQRRISCDYGTGTCQYDDPANAETNRTQPFCLYTGMSSNLSYAKLCELKCVEQGYTAFPTGPSIVYPMCEFGEVELCTCDYKIANKPVYGGAKCPTAEEACKAEGYDTMGGCPIGKTATDCPYDSTWKKCTLQVTKACQTLEVAKQICIRYKVETDAETGEKCYPCCTDEDSATLCLIGVGDKVEFSDCVTDPTLCPYGYKGTPDDNGCYTCCTETEDTDGYLDGTGNIKPTQCIKVAIYQ